MAIQPPTLDCMNLPNDVQMLSTVLSSSSLQWTLTLICYKSWRELPTKQILGEREVHTPCNLHKQQAVQESLTKRSNSINLSCLCQISSMQKSRQEHRLVCSCKFELSSQGKAQNCRYGHGICDLIYATSKHVNWREKKPQTFWMSSESMLQQYLVKRSSGFVEFLYNKLTLTRVVTCIRTSAVSSSVRSPPAATAASSVCWLVSEGKRCERPFGYLSSCSTTMQWKIANILSRGKLPGPLSWRFCASASFFSTANAPLLCTTQQWIKR